MTLSRFFLSLVRCILGELARGFVFVLAFYAVCVLLQYIGNVL